MNKEEFDVGQQLMTFTQSSFKFRINIQVFRKALTFWSNDYLG